MRLSALPVPLSLLACALTAFAQSTTNQNPSERRPSPGEESSTDAQSADSPKYPPGPIYAGPITLTVKRFDVNSSVDVFGPIDELIAGKLNIPFNINGTSQLPVEHTTVSDLAKQLESLGAFVDVVSGKSGSKLMLKTAPSATGGESAPIMGVLRTEAPSPRVFGFVKNTPDYQIYLDTDTSTRLHAFNNDPIKNKGKRLSIYVRSSDGTVYDLARESWTLEGRSKPLALLIIGNQDDPICNPVQGPANAAHLLQLEDISLNSCHLEFTLARRLAQEDVIKATMVQQNDLGTQSDLLIYAELLLDSQQFVVVNGKRLNRAYGPFRFDLSFAVSLSIYRVRNGCRLFSSLDYDWASVKFYPPPPPNAGRKTDNGITVGPGKIFDTLVLKKMLSDTAAQLASISGFSSAPITSAFGNLQGVTRDVSFLSGQVTTTPLPSVTSALTNGTTGGSSTTTPIVTSPGTVVVQCPNGSLPTVGPGGLQGCTALPSGSNITGSSSSVTTIPAGTAQQITGTTNSEQNSQTTTVASIAPTVPTAPVSTALSAPTNIGVSSADILAEQVQLNSQITTLRLLLQGAASDQYLTSEARATGTRQQTTLGFAVSIDPPRQYKHAVAEVRIIIVPPVGRDGVSIMALLPTEKTYNVAKVTSRQSSFGAGVAVEPVSAGFNTGKSKDRLYLAKDTDTIALQYREPRVPQVQLPFWQRAYDKIASTIYLNPLDPCAELTAPTRGAVVLGWQFRPVLGADYVKGGQRQVFAQLALPAGLNEDYVPAVYVQTRWRTYDSRQQVVGSVYKNACSVDTDRSGVTLLSPLIVRQLNITDIGNGQVRLTAKGAFFASGMAVRSGFTNVTPTTFDGTSIETFASVHDVLQAGDLSLISQNGIRYPFAILTDPQKSNQCGIKDANLEAIPRPDGNAYVHMRMKLGSEYALGDDDDGSPQPFVLIGSQVYGVQENPFVRSMGCRTVDDATGPECDYNFLAPTSLLMNAQSFLVEDIAWDTLKKRGTIDFGPAFDKLAISSAYPTKNDDNPKGMNPAAKPQDTDTTLFAVSGFNLGELDTSEGCGGSRPLRYCLELFIGNEKKSPALVTVASENLATILISSGALGKAKDIRFQIHKKGADAGPILWDLPVEWDLPIPKAEDSTKPSVTPAYLYKGDSQTVTITGGNVDFSTVKDVLFNDKVYSPPPKTKTSTKMELLISTDITNAPGRKEFVMEIVGAHGTQSKASFFIDVARR
jgi:hypothetical protein